MNERVETGPIQFPDDWPGLFIRGDNAMFYAMALRQVLPTVGMLTAGMKSALEGLAEELESCHASRDPACTLVKRCE